MGTVEGVLAPVDEGAETDTPTDEVESWRLIEGAAALAGGARKAGWVLSGASEGELAGSACWSG